MPSRAASPTAVRNLLRRFGRSRRASAAVEFALVAPVFFALLFAIIETAILFFASQVLESVTQYSARYIMTGQAQTQNYQSTDFKTYLCNQIPAAMFTCANIYVDVQSYAAFGSITNSSNIDGSNNFINNMQYSPGVQGQIVVVRVFYQWPLFVTGLGYNIANLTGSKRLLMAAAAFVNEPY
jgi:Flp pilus assembly protein TadG